jgi:hypothetical protein
MNLQGSVWIRRIAAKSDTYMRDTGWLFTSCPFFWCWLHCHLYSLNEYMSYAWCVHIYNQRKSKEGVCMATGKPRAPPIIFTHITPPTASSSSAAAVVQSQQCCNMHAASPPAPTPLLPSSSTSPHQVQASHAQQLWCRASRR